MVAAC